MDYSSQSYDWFENFHDNFKDDNHFDNIMTGNFYFNEYNYNLGVKSGHELHQFAQLSIYDYNQHPPLDQLVDHSKPFYQSTSSNMVQDNNFVQTSFGSAPESLEDVAESIKPERSMCNNRRRRHETKALNIVHWTAEMVCDPQFDHLICWSHFEAGEFIIKNQTELARLWGRKQKKGNMDFAKYSRALRYHYIHSSHRELQSVPAKLIYRFSQSFMKKFVYPHLHRLQSHRRPSNSNQIGSGNSENVNEEYLPQDLAGLLDSESCVNITFY